MTNFETSIDYFASNNPIPSIHLAALFRLWVKFGVRNDRETCSLVIKSIFFRLMIFFKDVEIAKRTIPFYKALYKR